MPRVSSTYNVAILSRNFPSRSWRSLHQQEATLFARGRCRAMTNVRIRFHCLFCHGFEERKEKHTVSSSGVLAVDDLVSPMRTLQLARNALQFTPVVTIYTDGAASTKEQLAEAMVPSPDSFKVDEHSIARLEKGVVDAQVIILFS